MRLSEVEVREMGIYQTNGVCAIEIKYEIKDGLMESVEFVGGCPGNAQGIGSLVRGMAVDEVIERLRGIKCGNKNSSCPDQLAQALIEGLK